MTMTPADFRDIKGDPAGWSPADFDTYTVLSEICPPPHSAREMQEIAAGHDKDAVRETQIADILAGDGHTEAAGIWLRSAEASREYAGAARQGWQRYQAVLNGE
ncbi:hypothetical protein GCM10010347_64730 [Streptomyces cirratus]|uniref:Uncharacterized protein n=1 Tax=Streptomyces cirratus TaxID=68187 RepID=A0ABQ3F5B7_9ACTN|nr:hypothetical protein [Streptomyces cirratus]GHB84791.1 hypothetical protein GCM10010347_64730 [Streptomyces cirratus]